MVLVPVGRDEAVIRRHAWVSYSIIGLNLLVLIVMTIRLTTLRRSFVEDLGAALVVLHANPWLNLPPEMSEILSPHDMMKLRQMEIGVPIQVANQKVTVEQRRLNGFVASAADSYRKLKNGIVAFDPKTSSPLMIPLALFVHYSFINLLLMSLMLYTTGPFLEDVFGRPLFAGLYLSGGIVAMLVYASSGKAATAGSAGAVAAVVGAYLVRFFRSRIEFLFLPLMKRFFVPAFVAVGLWVFINLLSLKGASGPFAAANMAGFAYGAAFAVVVRFTKIEEKYVAPKVEEQISWELSEPMVAALAARDERDTEGVETELLRYIDNMAPRPEELLMALELARDYAQSCIDPIATRLLDVFLEKKNEAAAIRLITDMFDSSVAAPRFYTRAAAVCERMGQRDLATVAYQRLCTMDPHSPNAVRSLIRLGTLLRQQGDIAGAREAFTTAQRHAACPADVRATIETKLAQL